MTDFVTFNLIEGAFWVICSLICVLFLKRLKHMPLGYWYSLSSILFLFGVSDFIEARMSPSFIEPTGYWLFAWKAVCVIGLVLCLLWYFLKRLRSK
jgi:hypothetical protein